MPLSGIAGLQGGVSWEALQHALSVINEGIAVADPSQPDAPMVYVNDAFLRLTGYSREECIGRNCRFLQVRRARRGRDRGRGGGFAVGPSEQGPMQRACFAPALPPARPAPSAASSLH